MAGKQNKMDSFQGLPLASRIAQPLWEASTAQMTLPHAPADFLPSSAAKQKAEKNSAPEGSRLQPPKPSLVPTPELEVDRVDINFQMEIPTSAEGLASEPDLQASADTPHAF